MAMQMRLNLFQDSLPTWENITLEWLKDYLTMQYPEIEFKIFGNYIRQCANKKGDLDFMISKDGNLDIWKSNILIHLSAGANYGHYSHMSQAVDNFERFKEELPRYVESYKNAISGYSYYLKHGREYYLDN